MIIQNEMTNFTLYIIYPYNLDLYKCSVQYQGHLAM